MRPDLRETDEYAAVAEHVRWLYEPGFGRPHALAEPDITLDGSRVVVTGSVFDELVGTPRTALYSVQDGELVPMTAALGSARCGRFAPDGRTLAFLSDRAAAGAFQLFLLDRDRLGEAVPAPAVPGTVEYVHWSPDGRRVLLGVAGLGTDMLGYRGAGTERADGAGSPSWLPDVEDSLDESAWRTLWLYSLDTGELSQLSPEGLNCWEAGWCGPDAVLAITCNRPVEDDWYKSVLTMIDVTTGTTRLLLRSDVQLGWPSGSPDGRQAAVVQAICSDRGLVAGDVTVVDVATSGVSVLATASVDVTHLQWLGATRLGFVGLRHLDSVGGIVDLTTGAVTEVFSTDLSCGGGYNPDGAFTADGHVAVVRSGYHVPPQVALLGGDKDRVLASTAHPGTDYLVSVAGQAAPVTWSAPDGLEIEGMLCTPPGAGPFPLVVSIHGGPTWAIRNMWSMYSAYVPLLVSRGYAVLCPNPRGAAGRGQEFAGAVVGDMGGVEVDDFLSGIDALVERGIADPARIGLIGGSYGGFMVSWLVTQDQRFAAAIPVAPVTDWYSMAFTSAVGSWGNSFLASDPEQPGTLIHTRSPVLQASKVRTPCLTVAGARDRGAPPGQAREFHQALLAHGAESVLAIYPLEGHGIRSFPAVTDFLTRVVTWFDQHM